MKVAVIKLGSRIAYDAFGTSGGTGEALSIIKLLIQGGCEVDAYTKVLRKDITPFDFRIFDIESHYDILLNSNYDALIVINGNVNYFGGQDDPSQTLNYYVINKFKGKVFYILCDCNLLLKQIWKSIENKEWSNKYKKEDIEITRDDIIYISQPREVNKVLNLARKYINIKDCVHFPFEMFPLISSKKLSFNEQPIYDLLYGGTFRNGRREDDMIKFYFDNKIFNVCMFGKISEKNFNKNKIIGLKCPKFEQSVSYNYFNNKMNQSKATVIIGDKLYKELDDLAQRIYECINAGVVTLIDSSYDKYKRVFANYELRDFCYVNDRNDVINRLARLNDISFRKHIVELQWQDTDECKYNYCNDFVKLIGGELCR